jgi:sugar phosphate isomerase/epimerase
MKYSMTLASFRKIEPLEKTLEKLVRLGYYAIEMYGEPQQTDTKKLKDILSSYNITVCGITGMWGSISKDGWKRKLLSSNADIVQASEKYVRDCVELCNMLGGNEMNICLFADDEPGFDKTHGTISTKEKETFASKAAPVMRRLCKFADNYGINLLLEPLNRYSTPYCANANDALAIVQQVDLLGILLDTFHMNIEEDSFADAIISSSDFLLHMHFADNNRKMPGFAHVDFEIIMQSLLNIGYSGYISFEPNISNRNYDFAIQRGLEFVKAMEMRYTDNRTTTFSSSTTAA